MHDHSHAPADYNKTFALGVALNIAYVLLEASYGWRINSLAPWPTPATT